MSSEVTEVTDLFLRCFSVQQTLRTGPKRDKEQTNVSIIASVTVRSYQGVLYTQSELKLSSGAESSRRNGYCDGKGKHCFF